MNRPPVRVVVRCIPAIFSTHMIDIDVGEPEAHIGISRSRCRHPDPWHSEEPSPACRDLIVAAAQRTVSDDGHIRWIVWPGGDVTAFTRSGATARQSWSPA